jgi:hypothetical protein
VAENTGRGGTRIATAEAFDRVESFARRQAPSILVLALVALLLVPWTVWLATRLPSRHLSPHWDVQWVGFDVALTATFAATAVSLWRRSALVPYLCTAAGALLLSDAWFDLSTARTTRELFWAIGVAALAEIPLAILCFLIVRRWHLSARALEQDALGGRETET